MSMVLTFLGSKGGGKECSVMIWSGSFCKKALARNKDSLEGRGGRGRLGDFGE